jgi:hypothetical protein
MVPYRIRNNYELGRSDFPNPKDEFYLSVVSHSISNSDLDNFFKNPEHFKNIIQ